MAETYIVPLLCTRGVVFFPSHDNVIDVGREESVKAVNYANDNNSLIFVSTQRDIMNGQPTEKDVYEIGCLCRVKKVKVKSDFLRVGIGGIKRARLIQGLEINGIKAVEVEVIEEIVDDEMVALNLHDRILSIIRTNRAYLPSLTDQNKVAGFQSSDIYNISDRFASTFVINYKDKQSFLEEINVTKRLELCLEHIRMQSEVERIDSEIEQKVKENIEESQREYYLREKLKTIKEELNDGNNLTDIDALRAEVESKPYPQHVKDKAYDEIAKLEIMPTASGEFSVIRTYLDWLLKTPWYEASVDNDDLNVAREILDADHFGLEKVKERILEYLAVKQMTNSLKSPIICLVGPPGVGKTSLAKSVAKALDRKFVKVSLGGVKDESEIRGHRRTYLGSLPGRIIQGMKKAGTVNPVFLIDEIDKMASDYKGDPSSAMLEVLDPEQNAQFSDHYLEEPYDLSDVLFIATANYIENIPAALQDRLEIINLSSYTELEKLEIAKRHLVTKQLAANGLKASQFSIDDDALLYLLRYYTREAGVRQLERLIGSLCRKSVLAILSQNKRKIKITKKLIREWLGAEKFEYGAKEKQDQVGVVTGLAYTSFGGDVLQIEVNYFDGKGNFVVTGQLGDVMKESAKIALDYIKSNAKKFGIDPVFFEKHDIHIHVPEGAVPKDGPSAGVTLTTAIVSALTNQKVRANIAMTGEVTLRGNVLPIGGLKEKSLAAHRSGITTILFPKANIKDLEEVPTVVKEAIEFIPVEQVDAVLKHALVK